MRTTCARMPRSCSAVALRLPLMSAMVKKAGQQKMSKVKRTRTAPSALVPLPRQCGWIFRSSSKKSMVRRSGMPLSVSIALSNILLSLVAALVTSPGIEINAPGGVKKIACLSLRSLLILMVVCVIESTVLWLHVLNLFDCLLG